MKTCTKCDKGVEREDQLRVPHAPEETYCSFCGEKLTEGVDRITLVRYLQTPKSTKGVILLNDKVVCSTLELPWKENVLDTSCISAGRYPFERYESAKFGRTCLRIKDVPLRTGIAVHNGNHTSQTEGCILVGTTHSKKPLEIHNSRVALRALILSLKHGNGVFTITNKGLFRTTKRGFDE